MKRFFLHRLGRCHVFASMDSANNDFFCARRENLWLTDAAFGCLLANMSLRREGWDGCLEFAARYQCICWTMSEAVSKCRETAWQSWPRGQKMALCVISCAWYIHESSDLIML